MPPTATDPHRRSLLVVLLSAVTACSGTDPEQLDLSGRWSGAVAHLGVTLDLTHDLSTAELAGTWTVTAGPTTYTGTTEGRLSRIDNTVSLDLHHPQQSYLYHYSGQVTPDATSMRGTFRNFDGETRRLDLDMG